MSEQKQVIQTFERVCMIAEHIPPDYSGAGRQATLLAKNLSELGHEVFIITKTPNPSTSENSRLHIIPLKSNKDLACTQFAWQCFRWLLFNSKKYDLIHLHGLNRATWGAIIANKILGKPILFKYTLPADEAPEIIRASRLGKIKWRLFKTMDAYIATSSKFHKILSTEIIPNITVHLIPNGVDCNVFKPLARDTKQSIKECLQNEMNWPDATLIGMYLGGIEPRKGLETLLSSWRDVVKEIPEVRLLLVGPVTKNAGKSFNDKLSAQIHEWGLGNYINFYGLSDSPETLLPLADIFILPSDAEGLPNALIEAQACGIPAVASHLDGITTDIVLQDKTGYLIQCKDKKALTEAVITILKNPRWYSAETQLEIIQHIKQHFSIESIAEQYSALYKKLSKRNSTYV